MPDQSRIEHLASRVKAFGQQFYVQLGHVKAKNAQGQTVERFADAFPIVFSENEESAFLFWKNIPIRFHYTYELYANIDTLIIWFEKMMSQTAGEYSCTLLTDVYILQIDAAWDAQNLKIHSNWMVMKHHQKMADLLNQKGALVTTVDGFLAEWKPLLVQIIRGIEASGIAFSDVSETDKIRRLKAITPYIANASKLYAQHGN
jgi:hypothetical protein